MKETDTQLVFELGHLVAERRLGDKHPFGRLGKAAAVGDGHKVAQLAEFHGGRAMGFRTALIISFQDGKS
ncbi:hypothetical protein Y695_03858 [Hydrogenophaga sp. T4]|nr:hypothetical protein Y695_03858 [Hydrogenophaga sp. T4]